MKIVFMGTPEFAVPSLDILVTNGFDIVAVITAPDKPKGRGKQLATSAVKDYAVEKQLRILQPTNLKNPEFLAELKSLKADLQVVVAFRMLPESVWSMPPLGTFNLHGSLLPQYRGAAPINWAIINGEKETGVTTFFLQHEIDTGEIIFQEKEHIHLDDNVGTLYERLMKKGADLVLKTANAIQSGNPPRKSQDVRPPLKSAPKIFRETCKIDWSLPANEIRNHVRGLAPYPSAWTLWGDKNLKVFRVEVMAQASAKAIGTIWIENKKLLSQATDAVLELVDVQLEGKKRMKAEELVRGLQNTNQ